MKNPFLILSFVFFLTSCGDSSDIKEQVRQHLKDPGSAQFKDEIFSTDKKRACIVWNSKNSMGGYGDWNVAELTKKTSGWVVTEMEGSKKNCSEIGFSALDAGEKAESEAQVKAIDILRKVKNLSSQEAAKISIRGTCKELVWSYSYNSRNVAEYRVRQDRAMLERYEEDRKKNQAELEAGNC